jgi:hypothetical protein
VSDPVLQALRSGNQAPPVVVGDPVLAALRSPPVKKDVVGRPGERSVFSQPYGYYTPEVQSLVGNDGSQFRPFEEIAPGINQGVAHILGMPVTTLVDAANLASAGMGYLQSKITGEAPSSTFDPVDPASIPLSGAWNEAALNSTPLGDVTSVRNPDDATSRVFHAAASGIPGGVTGGGPGIAAGIAGAGAAGVGSELGLDPASQAALSLLAGHAAARLSEAAPGEPLSRPTQDEPSAQEKLNAAASEHSMGASGAAVDLQKLSPELKSAVEKAVQQTGGAVNPEAMARHIQADSLPVKVQLSEGQVLGDPRLISEERNARGATPGYVEGFAAQNKALTANMRAFRDTAGENVFSTNQVEHGDTLIGRYKAIDEARTADISAKYQALRDAAGGEFPVDVQSLLGNVKTELGKQLLTHDAPPSVMHTLEELSQSGSMTFEQFESLRTNLARLQRSHSVDGNQRFAAGVIRDQMEQIPMTGAAANLKPLADSARAAARERFQALEADPAYKAAVNETTPPDKFVQKFVITGARDNVAKLSQAMAGDMAAAQTLKVATLDHLRQAAGIDASFNGNFSQAGYNKALRALEPKLGSLLDPKLTEHVQTLGDVARYSQLQPEGHYVNNSNTSVAQRALGHGADVLEGMANVKAGGVPVGSWIRQNVTDRQGRKAAAKTFAPGAGLTRLSDLSKVGKEEK